MNAAPESWDERYRSSSPFFAPLPFIAEWETKVAALTGGRGTAVDLACGSGRHALHLAERGWNVIAIDLSTTALALLAGEAARRNVSLQTMEMDLEAQDVELPEASFIVDSFFLHWPLFSAIKHALVPNGVFVAALPVLDDDPEIRPMNPRFLANGRELRRIFAGWNELHYSEVKPGGRRKMLEYAVQRPAAQRIL